MNPNTEVNSRFTLHCTAWGPQHVFFSVFDAQRANCGRICIRIEDVAHFVRNTWKSGIFWNDEVPADFKFYPEFK